MGDHRLGSCGQGALGADHKADQEASASSRLAEAGTTTSTVPVAHDDTPNAKLAVLELRQLGEAIRDQTNSVAGKVDSIVQSAVAPVNSAVGNIASTVNGMVASALALPSNIPASSNHNPPNIPTSAANYASAESRTADQAPGSTEPPPAVAAADARNQALYAEEKMAMQDSNLPRPPPSTAMKAANAAPSPSPMSIQVLGSTSQEVLSSPHTPLPLSPEASQRPPSSSYFSSTPPTTSKLAASSLADTSAPPSIAPSAVPVGHNTINATTSSMSTTGLVTSISTTDSASVSDTVSVSSTESPTSLTSLGAMTTSSYDSSLIMTSSGSATDVSPMSSGALTTMMTMSSTSSESSSQAVSSSSTGVASSITGGIGGASATGAGTSPSTTSSSGSGSKSTNNIPPETQQLVGGIIGGVAGIALILIAILFIMRWRKRRQGGQRRIISPPIPQASESDTAAGRGGAGTMTQRSSMAPIAGAGFLGRFRPSSSQTATTAETAPSERGFQNYGGRKLESVLKSGGDGYGDTTTPGPSGVKSRGIAPGHGPFAGLAPGMRPSPSHSLSGSSFYQDSNGFYGGVVPSQGHEPTERSDSPASSSPTYPSPLAVAGGASATPGRKPTMREGPARTPMITQVGRPSPRQSPHADRSHLLPGSNDPRDLIGRSLASQDGSRTSRFRESTTPP